MEQRRYIFDISIWTLAKIAMAVLLFWFLFLSVDLLIVIFLSVIIASAISPVVGYLAAKRIPRVWGVLLVYLLVAAFLAFLMYLIVPLIVNEIRQLAILLPEYYESASSKFSNMAINISPEYAKSSQDFLMKFGETIKDASSSILGVLASIFGSVATLSIVFVISFYMAVQEKGVENFIRIITPKDDEEYALNLWKRVEKKLGLWLQGQLILGFVVGLAVFIGLSIIGVPYALLLGIIAGLFEIIPMAGPLLSAIVGVSVALVVNLWLGVLTLIFYIIIQQTENHILVPLLMKKMTGLNPIVIIVALMAGLELGGVLGMLISVPIATIIGELLADYSKSKEKTIEADA